MQDDPMALIGENLSDHKTEAVRRTGDEDARHIVLPMLRLAINVGRRTSACAAA
jgi:hypothetical protein